MSLFSKQTFPHEESAIQTQPGTRSLYRLPPLHGKSKLFIVPIRICYAKTTGIPSARFLRSESLA